MNFAFESLVERSVKFSKGQVSQERIAKGDADKQQVYNSLDKRAPEKIKSFIRQFNGGARLFGYSFDPNTKIHKAYILLENCINKVLINSDDMTYQTYNQDKKLLKLYNADSTFKAQGISIKKYLRYEGKIKDHLPRLIQLIDKKKYSGSEWLKKNQDVDITYIAFTKHDITLYYVTKQDLKDMNINYER